MLLRHFRDLIAMYSYTHALLRTYGSLSWLRSGADTTGEAGESTEPGSPTTATHEVREQPYTQKYIGSKHSNHHHSNDHKVEKTRVGLCRVVGLFEIDLRNKVNAFFCSFQSDSLSTIHTIHTYILV